MNIAIILAGGDGSRTGLAIPKQFIEIKRKPILVYTLERFEHHPLTDSILIVCKEGWEEKVQCNDFYNNYYIHLNRKVNVPRD